MSKPALNFYYDLLSQPSRALYIFLKITNIPHEQKPVALRNAEHLTEEYKKNVNRFQMVPCINDNGFKLAESVAILRYLARENKIPDKWYPSESKLRARVDEYLEWQHNNTRISCGMYFLTMWLYPLLTGKPPKPETVEELKTKMEGTLNLIENIWLDKNDYIAGNEISAADIWAACEIEQTRMAGYDASQGRPKLAAWINRVRKETSPYYEEAHKILNKIAKL